MRAAVWATYWSRLRRHVRRGRLRLAICWRRLWLGNLLEIVRRDARNAARVVRQTRMSATGAPDAGRAVVDSASEVPAPAARRVPTATPRSPRVRKTDR